MATDPFKKMLADMVFSNVPSSVFTGDEIEKVEVHRTDDLNVLLRVTSKEPTGPYRTRRRDFTLKFSEMY